jgi:micrococcal nuclease
MNSGVFAGEFFVSKVIDGDTVVLENGEHVRYIGIDTPEKGRPYYSEAKRQNEKLVKGRKVVLEFDAGKADRYGRVLAYVYAGNTFVNEELVKNGYALAYTVPPNVKFAKRFVSLQEEARTQKRGLWGLKPSEIDTIKGGRNYKPPEENKTIWDYILHKLK